MKNSYFIFTFLLFMVGVSAKATNPNEKTNPTSETTEVKSNVVIFKIIPNSSSTSNENPTNSSTSSSGSLKKAGKVARTSYSHSLENIIYKKKGI